MRTSEFRVGRNCPPRFSGVGKEKPASFVKEFPLTSKQAGWLTCPGVSKKELGVTGRKVPAGPI